MFHAVLVFSAIWLGVRTVIFNIGLYGLLRKRKISSRFLGFCFLSFQKLAKPLTDTPSKTFTPPMTALGFFIFSEFLFVLSLGSNHIYCAIVLGYVTIFMAFTALLKDHYDWNRIRARANRTTYGTYS